MTVNVARRRPRARRPTDGPTVQLNIGEIEQTIFACPNCARPLAIGSHQCPGCGTRLVMGVQLRRASVFTAAGLFAGLLLGAGGVAGMSTLDRLGREASASSMAAAAGAGATVPTAGPISPSATASGNAATPSARPTGTPPTARVPALSRSAIGQAVALNGTLRDSGATLAAALGAKRFDAFEVSKILRAMSSDAVVGLGLTSHIGAWSGGAAVASELTAFYAGIQAAAAEGLAASIRNEGAYRVAATRMVKLLAGLEAIDGAVRDASVAAGVTLPAASATP